MFEYRKKIYQDYYNSHSGVEEEKAQFELFNLQKRYFKREILPILKVDKTARILDIGCGTGSFLRMLNDNGFENTEGIDLSAGQLKMAEKFGVKNTNYSDALSFLKNKKEEYDLISAIDLLEHLSKDELVELLESIRLSLKKGGQLVARVPNTDAPMSSVFFNADITHETGLNASSMSQVLKATQFEDVEIVPSLIFIENPVKELFRKVLWWKTKLLIKILLYASGRTWHKVVFTPNLLASARK